LEVRELVSYKKAHRVLEEEGSTPEAAIESALRKLNISREEANVEILEEGNKGLFGMFGSRLAKVRITVEDSALEEVADICKDLLELMHADASFEVKRVDDEIYIDISGPDAGLLIGKRGQNLNALRFLVELLAKKRHKVGLGKVTIDIEGYLSKRRETLISLAKRLAKEVSRTKKEKVLEPMIQSERKVIHMTLQDYRDVKTRSKGEGLSRRVVISPQRSEKFRSKR
jgi:spoIIIJ-associated protein